MPYLANFETVLVAGSLLVLVVYHFHLHYVNRNNPTETAFGRNARTRAAWVQAVMESNRDILAIQTLRNWTMAASFLASTAILIALAVLNVALNAEPPPEVSQLLNFFGSRSEEIRLVKFVALSIDFFFAFFNFTLAIRYYNHVGFMINVPIGQKSLVDLNYVTETVNLGATHYYLGMRGYYIAIPLTLWLVGPIWLFAGAAILVVILHRLDRTG